MTVRLRQRRGGCRCQNAHPILFAASAVDIQTDLLRVLDDVLSLRGRALGFDAATPLLGGIPELDSMAVVTLITTLEERFGLVVDDDEISGDTFETVGSLTRFVAGKLSA